MGLGTSLVLIAVGAILRFAVSVSSHGVNIHTVGVILMIVGIVGFVISLVGSCRRRAATATHAARAMCRRRCVTPSRVTESHRSSAHRCLPGGRPRPTSRARRCSVTAVPRRSWPRRARSTGAACLGSTRGACLHASSMSIAGVLPVGIEPPRTRPIWRAPCPSIRRSRRREGRHGCSMPVHPVRPPGAAGPPARCSPRRWQPATISACSAEDIDPRSRELRGNFLSSTQPAQIAAAVRTRRSSPVRSGQPVPLTLASRLAGSIALARGPMGVTARDSSSPGRAVSRRPSRVGIMVSMSTTMTGSAMASATDTGAAGRGWHHLRTLRGRDAGPTPP